MTVIRWTDAERSLVVAETARLRREDLAQSLPILLNIAQANVLPKSRQRSTLTLQSCGAWFLPAVRTEFNAKTPIERIEVEKIVTIPQSLKTVATAELLTELLLRAAGRLDQLDTLLTTYASPAVKPVAATSVATEIRKAADAAKPGKPVVVIAGVIQNQPQYFEQKLGNHVDFVFVRADTQNIGQVPKQADRVYVFTKFVSHGVQQMLRNRFNGQVTLHAAGITTLVDRIAKELHIAL